MYTCTFPSTITGLKMAFIIIWKVASEFVNPKNITVGSKSPSLVMKATFSLSPSLILMLLMLKLHCSEGSSEVKDTTDVRVFCSRYETGS